MECAKLVHQWKVKEKHLFVSSHFAPNKFKPSIFSFDLKLLFYHGLRLLLTHILPFPRSKVMIVHFNVTSPPHLHCRFDFDWSSDFFPFLEIMASHMVTSYGPQVAQANEKSSPESFDPNVTFSWWKTWNSIGARSSWNWTPSNLVLSYFSKLLLPSDLIASRPCFWWQTWNRLWRLLRNWKYFYFRMVFNSRCWTLSLVAWFDSSTTS